MLGASGALMGFEGAYLGLALRYQLPAPHIWPMAHPIQPAQLAALGVVGVAFDFHDVFLGSDDVDKTIELITANGGSVVRAAEDTPYGRLAAVTDPTGAAFNLSSIKD